MPFRRYAGKPSVRYFSVGDTTIRISEGGAVRLQTTGQLINLANDSTDEVIGVSQKTVATTDSDDLVPVQMAEENITWEVDTDSDGGAAATDVGQYCSIDTGDTVNVNASVDVSDSAFPHFFILEVVSATKVRGRFATTALRNTFDTV